LIRKINSSSKERTFFPEKFTLIDLYIWRKKEKRPITPKVSLCSQSKQWNRCWTKPQVKTNFYHPNINPFIQKIKAYYLALFEDKTMRFFTDWRLRSL
jgi:hypothetical protein